MTRTPEFYIDRANELFQAGFSSKAAQKDCLRDVNEAFELIKGAIQADCLKTPRNAEGRMADPIETVYWDIPMYPHLWKPRHAEMVRTAFGAEQDNRIDTIEQLAAFRAAVKAAAVTPPAKSGTAERVAKVTGSIRELLERRQEQFNRALDLGSVFTTTAGEQRVSLPVHANVHLVTNEHGTTFLRAFYYLNGAFTPLSVILAAFDQLTRELEQGA